MRADTLSALHEATLRLHASLTPSTKEAAAAQAVVNELSLLMPQACIAARVHNPQSGELYISTSQHAGAGMLHPLPPVRFEVALQDDDNSWGAIEVGYPEHVVEGVDDRLLTQHLASLLALYLPTARLAREATYLRQHVDRLVEQIVHAERLATLGRLAAGIVHELNNPVTSIAVYSEYLLKKNRDHGAASADIEKLQRIVASAGRIARFTRDLVAYARPSTQKPQRLSVHEVLEQSLVFCEHVLRKHRVVVERRYAASYPEVEGVTDQLLQVFINLITNACQAMPNAEGDESTPLAHESTAFIEVADALGERRLSITTETCGDRLCIRLHDNGGGIQVAPIEKIFEPFFSTKGKDKGTGLGLSIVKSIVEQHQGSIQVSSHEDEGTVFSLFLPLAIAEDPPLEALASSTGDAA